MPVYDAGAIDELPDGEISLARFGRREVALVRRGDEVFALANRCPHQGAAMCVGRLRDHVDSPAVGKVAIRPDVPVLACPWHGWEFELATGASVFDPRYRVKTYPVQVEDGRVRVQIGAKRDG